MKLVFNFFVFIFLKGKNMSWLTKNSTRAVRLTQLLAAAATGAGLAKGGVILDVLAAVIQTLFE